jgi:hypothetical protein
VSPGVLVLVVIAAVVCVLVLAGLAALLVRDWLRRRREDAQDARTEAIPYVGGLLPDLPLPGPPESPLRYPLEVPTDVLEWNPPETYQPRHRLRERPAHNDQNPPGERGDRHA